MPNSTTNNSEIVNLIAARQCELWEAKEQSWHGTWDICASTTSLEKLAGSVAEIFYHTAIGIKPCYNTLDNLISEYKS